MIQMDRYVPYDITEKAKTAAAEEKKPRIAEEPLDPPSFRRIPERRKDLRYLEQLADPGQVCALGRITAYLLEQQFDGKRTLQEVLDAFSREISEHGFSAFCDSVPGDAAMPRMQEIYGCLNRCRLLRMR